MNTHTEDTGNPAQRVLYRVGGLLLLLALWHIASKLQLGGKTLPAFIDVLKVFGLSWRRALLLRAATATTTSAGIGLLAGALLGCLTALTAHWLPLLAPGLDHLAVVVNALPAIALGPVLIITAGRESTPALLAAIPVFFLLYVAAGNGLQSADRRLQQLFTASGASRWQRLRYLDTISALPSLLSGLKLAVTTAMIGAVVGEWFGAPTGLGIVILNTMQNFQIPLMGAAILVVAAISLTGYGLLGLLERFVERKLI